MRSKPTLVVDTTKNVKNESEYELNISPRASFTSLSDTKPTTTPTTTTQQSSSNATTIEPTPSIRLLFSLVSRYHFLVLLLPAILSSMTAGGIAPFMTIVVGNAFNTFAQFPLSPLPPQQQAAAQATLLHQIGISCIELVALAVGSVALGSLTSSLWIWVGEINAMSVRTVVYQTVVAKEMVWFDTHLGAGEPTVDDSSNGPLGAGGLMAKFAKFVSFFIYFPFFDNSCRTK
jgi:ATP-binding cassette, subfamily B (MDR/TAP), member 1